QRENVESALRQITLNPWILPTLRDHGVDEKFLNIIKALRIRVGVDGEYPCDNENTNAAGFTHDSNGNPLPNPEIVLCPRFFEELYKDNSSNYNRRAGVLLHEILHLVGATELDADLAQFILGWPGEQYPFA